MMLALGLLAGCAVPLQQMASKEVQARMDLSTSYLSKDQPRRSLKELLAVEDKASNIPKYHFLLGTTYQQLDKLEQARDHFVQATELDKGYGEAWNSLGQVLVSLDKPDKAEQAFKEALSIQTYLTPEYPAYNLALLYRDRSKPQEARDYAQKAIDENWRFLPAYELLAEMARARGDIEQATSWLKKGVDANPNSVQIMMKLAENQLRMGQHDKARYWFSRILSLQPESEAAQVARDYLDILPE
jgi:Tfp pilus assembly protein PilF